jgi:hypothetical protein
VTFAGTGTIVVGDFLAAAGEEVGLVSSSRFQIFNPSSRESTEGAFASGIPVDEININRLQSSGGTGGNPGNGNSGGGGGTVPDGGLAAVCGSYTSILNGQMLIKSEISNHINSGDARATGYTLVCGSQCPANLRKTDFFYANGLYAGSVGYYGTFSGNGRPRLYGAASAAPQHFVNLIAAKARTIGNGKLYIQISSATGSTAVCKEFNPTGRNGGI